MSMASKGLSNIKPNELEAFRELAEVILGNTNIELAKRGEDGGLYTIGKPKGEGNA